MNSYMAAGGSIGSLLLIMGIVIAIIDGLRTAIAVIGIVLACLAFSVALTLFWVWVAGGFA